LAEIQLLFPMKHRWSIARKGHQRFFARSENGRLAGYMTRDGLVAFLSSRGVREPPIRVVLYDLENPKKLSVVRVDLDDGWR
jgi:hypothetical protein